MFLSINCGSSSLKWATFDENLLEINRSQVSDIHDLSAFFAALEKITGEIDPQALVGIGHRFVHGGTLFTKPAELNSATLNELSTLIPFDPIHLPTEIEIAKKLLEWAPNTLQTACFDTAFHSTLEEEAYTLPIPRAFGEKGVRKYGFHGLSYEYLIQKVSEKRVVIAHLGSGSSVTAIDQGRSVDTTMGLTSIGGVVMASRSGDLDPGVLLYLLTQEKLSVDEVNTIVAKEGGIKGISGLTNDVKTLLDHENRPLAIAIFADSVAKAIAALTTRLKGLDCLVFSAGIGENSAIIREMIVEKLEWMGLKIDAEKNKSNASQIAAGNSLPIRVIPTDEELMIAQHVKEMYATTTHR